MLSTTPQNLVSSDSAEEKLRTELITINHQVWKITSTSCWREKTSFSELKGFLQGILEDAILPVKIYKAGSQRKISLINQGRLQGVLKTYFKTRQLFTQCKQLLTGNTAYREFQNICRVHNHGIKTPAPYFVAELIEGHHPISSLLFLEEISQTENLTQLLELNSLEEATSIATQLGALIAQLQNAGLFHRDLHGENFLWQSAHVEGTALKPAALWLLDLQGITTQRRLTHSQVVQNLGQLFYSLGRDLPMSVVWTFWQKYWQGLSLELQSLFNTTDSHQAFLSMAPLCRKHVETSLLRGDRKWERGNRRLRIIKTKSAHTRALSSIDKQTQQAVQQMPLGLFDDATNMKSIKSSSTREIAVIEHHGFKQSVFAKWEKTSRLKSAFPGIGKYSPARHAWEIGHAFKRRRIPTPIPLLMYEKLDLKNYEGMIITEALPEAIALSAFLLTYLQEMNEVQANRWIKSYVPLIARSLARMHQGNFDHRDLKSNNLLVAHDFGKTASWIIDLDAVRKWPMKLPVSRRAQNLARLVADLVLCPRMRKTMLLKALRYYLQEFHDTAAVADWKILWKTVEQQVSSIQKRKNKQQSAPAQKRHAA